MKVALTGGTGFLGRYLASQLKQAGHQLVGLLRDHPRRDRQLPDIQWLPGQLGDMADSKNLVESADIVVHAGLYRDGRPFMEQYPDPLTYWQTNATGSMMLLEAAAQADVAHFIFISSGAVHDRVMDDRPLDESHPLLPTTLYGACKASVETLIHHYGKSGRLKTSTVRPTAIYGVADPVENSKWFSLIDSVRRGETVEATGGSKSVHAQDVAKTVELLMRCDESVSGETFNCCDAMISDFQVATLAKQLTGSASSIQGAPKRAKHEIRTDKLRALGLEFGGTALLEQTVAEILSVCDAQR